MKASVIISTYNSPEWLEKVLWGYHYQLEKGFEIIIADDGSTSETKNMLKSMADKTGLEINHVWHKDEGFQKTRILNKAILATKTDYLIFTDGDCIPRKDFVKTHLVLAEKGKFLSGGYCKLTMKVSKIIQKGDIESQDCFDLKWLGRLDKLSFSNTLKLGSSSSKKKVLDTITLTKASFNGCNSSVFKKDALAINGFDERMQYGGEDREFGERLINYGVSGKQIRHKAIVIHLDHDRGYKTNESMKKNLEIRKKVKLSKAKITPFGIKNLIDS